MQEFESGIALRFVEEYDRVVIKIDSNEIELHGKEQIEAVTYFLTEVLDKFDEFGR